MFPYYHPREENSLIEAIMVTREWLLKNGFEWREYSNNDYGEHSGEYVLHKYCNDQKYLILLKYNDELKSTGEPARWFVIVCSSIKDVRVEFHDMLNVSIKDLKDAIKLCGIRLKLKNL